MSTMVSTRDLGLVTRVSEEIWGLLVLLEVNGRGGLLTRNFNSLVSLRILLLYSMVLQGRRDKRAL